MHVLWSSVLGFILRKVYYDFLVTMLEVIDALNAAAYVVYCWVLIVSVPLPSVISQIDSPHGARSRELRGASPGEVEAQLVNM